MKTFLLSVFSFLVLNSYAATYYFSSSTGDDSRTAAVAQNQLTPWKTLQKFNSIVATLNPGDQVLFKRGDTFTGSITVGKSGTAALPITLGAYGTGARPIINGLESLGSGWTSLGNNKYERTCTDCPNYLNLMVIQDTIQPIGRFPKLDAPLGGYLYLNAHVGTFQISSNQIAGIPNFVGGELIIRPFGWIFNKATVNTQNSNSITYTPFVSPSHPNFTYEPQDGYGFFFQNHINALTQNGDWMYDVATKKLRIYFNTNPNNINIKVSKVERLVNIPKQSYLKFDGLAFRGGNINAFSVDSATHCVINDCEIDQIGGDGIYFNRKSSENTLSNSILTNSINNALNANGSPGWKITNNLFRNTGMIRGMGYPGDGNHNAIHQPGNRSLMQLNQIKRTGYIGIDFQGDSVEIRNNFIDSFCLIKSDGGAIYAAFEADKKARKIIGNIALHGLGDRFGRSQGEIDNPFAGNVHGIYLDLGAGEVTIDSNTSAFSANSGLQLSSSTNIVVRDNTFFDNIMTQVFWFETVRDFANLTYKKNIQFSKRSDQLIALFRAQADDQKTWGIIDSNYYARPVSEPNNVDTIGYSHAPTLEDYPDGGIVQAANERFYSLDKWKALSGVDQNTVKTPNHPTDLSQLRFEYNATTSPKVIALNGTYFDVKNVFYTNSVTLAPYSSIILLKYTGASVVNQTITFPGVPPQVFGNGAVTLAATASSNLPVSYAILSGPGTLNGNQLTITGAGTIVVQATQAGNATYAAAASVNQNIVVAKANQTITFASLPNKTFGDPPFSVVGSASSSLPVSFRIVSGPATMVSNMITLTGSGTVVVEASQAGNANYNAAPVVTRSFTVAAGTPQIPPVCSATGTIERQQWNNIFGTAVSDIPVNTTPSSTNLITKLETENTGDWMGSRIRGYLCPPVSGNYTFTIAGDDGVELWLSTDNTQANKKKIAGYVGWTGFQEWDKYPGQNSGVINLQVGQAYYIEVLHKNGAGGDHFSVKWTMPNGVTEAPIPGSRLSPFSTVVTPKTNQTITFDPLPGAILGDAPISLVASATSGLPVTFAVSGPASLAGNILSLNNTGTVTITASQAGNTAFNAAPNVVRSFVVSAAPIVTPSNNCNSTGTITREEWQNVFGMDVSTIPLNTTPASINVITSLQTENTGSNMGARIRGYVCPPISGNYTFYLAGDDGVELWLSTNNDPANKVKIAGYNGWTGFQEWDKYPGQKSGLINLQVGQSYYIEVLHKNGGGGDHVSVRWNLPNGAIEAPIPGIRLAPYVAGAKINQTISFNAIPSKTVGAAPFALVASATSTLPVGFAVISGPATVSGNMVTVTGTGTVTIEATQPGNQNYNAATAVRQSFAVNPAGTAVNPCSATGFIIREQWNNIFGMAVSNIPLNTAPNSTNQITKLETENTGDWMGARIRGYICPPLTGSYVFDIAGDDGVELWLSTSSNPSNKVKIAGYVGWTGFQEFNKYPGQKSAAITLTAGQSYYIEVLHKNGSGGDHLSVRWKMPNNVVETPIPGSRLAPIAALANRPAPNAIVNTMVVEPEQSTAKPALTVFPNPFRTSANVRIHAVETGETIVTITDLQGRTIRQLFKGLVEKGQTRSIQLNSAGLSSGVYFVRLVTNNSSVSQKVSLAK